MYAPIDNKSLYEQIVEQILSQVVSGALRPGDRLPPERELCAEFNVSRTVLREAINTLKQQGVVTVQQGRGTFITDQTSEALQYSMGLAMQLSPAARVADLIELREMLEPTIAGYAAERATDELIETLEQLVDRMDDVLTEPAAFISADYDFHLTLANAAKNTLLPTIMNSVVDLLQKQRSQIFKADGGQTRAQDYHKRIVEAVKDRNRHAAFVSMTEHLEQVRQDFESSDQRLS